MQAMQAKQDGMQAMQAMQAMQGAYRPRLASCSLQSRCCACMVTGRPRALCSGRYEVRQGGCGLSVAAQPQ